MEVAVANSGRKKLPMVRSMVSEVFVSAEPGAFVSSWGGMASGKTSFGGSVVACVAVSAATTTGAEEEVGIVVAR